CGNCTQLDEYQNLTVLEQQCGRSVYRVNPMKPGDIETYLSKPSGAELQLVRLFGASDALTIFDIGACEGEESIRYSRRFPRARLFSFEPLPANQALVRDNFARYELDAAELVPLALSDRKCESVFHV